ncbi:MAG: SpoIIE family protein phosphatase [Acidobacteria bacterium]|jgi:sigma-B regulation protein RsbU (phosphoserine phosphatase)|nr:SpoIIE family protein phosphatase [Acidobacteriota bacterium]
MKKRTLLYIPLVLLFALAVSVLAVHYRNLFINYSLASIEVQLPFTIDGSIMAVKPEAESAGLKVGDRILAINGRAIESGDIYREELTKLRPNEPMTLAVGRKTADGQTENHQIVITTKRLEKDFNFYSRLVVGFLFAYVLPTFCILLGFWVVFVRPQDALAWLLLFLLLGLSQMGLEGYGRATTVGFYSAIFFNSWALAMFLFGIYFPERWSVDVKIPWAKWIFIVPLAFQIFLALLSQIKIFLGINLIDSLDFIAKPYYEIAAPVNMLATSIFFAALGHKSGTLENPDARRRLKLMVIGTSVSMTPLFVIFLLRLFTGAKGSFFDIVPFWFALLALLLVLLFPLTLVYVIVVHRAMDVSVVVRQGLQYALAKNGVRVLQFFLLFAVGLGTLFTINNYGRNISLQIAFIVVGIALIPLIDFAAKRLIVWVDRKFFREAYNAEQILSDLSEDVRTMIETKPLLETVSSKISESLHVPQVALLLKNGGNFQPAYALGYKNAPNVSLNENNTTIEKLKTNEPLVIYQDDQDSWINDEGQTTERANLRELNSQLLLPFGAKNELSGLISLSPKLSDSPYTPTDLRLLKSVAAQTGLALENSRLTQVIVSEAAQKERINRELEIAREVQERLFPQELPKIEGLDYFGACRSALDVGGDYYDFIELPENKFGIAIGDISGKGIGASLMMASLQASLRGQAIHFKSDLAGLMKQINSLVYEASTSNRYATFFYAQYEPATRKLTYVNAGHNPPFLVRKSGEVVRLEEGGAVVGMLPSMLVNYKQGEIELQTGDLLVGYTDGISEAMNPQEDEWSEDAMLEELKKVHEKPAVEILPYIVACADEFASGAKQHDDMTMIVVKVI